MRRTALLLVVVLGVMGYGAVFAQQAGQQRPKRPAASDPVPRSDSPDNGEDQQGAPPLSPNESSSKQTQIDISPPKDDATKHPESEDVTEMHVWNPHKAEKDIEVGDFYMKRQNYRAAEDRYREALEYKPGDAVATFRLAEVLDAQKKDAEAAKEYQAYLKIPSNGKFNAEAKKALARLGK